MSKSKSFFLLFPVSCLWWSSTLTSAVFGMISTFMCKNPCSSGSLISAWCDVTVEYVFSFSPDQVGTDGRVEESKDGGESEHQHVTSSPPQRSKSVNSFLFSGHHIQKWVKETTDRVSSGSNRKPERGEEVWWDILITVRMWAAPHQVILSSGRLLTAT